MQGICCFSLQQLLNTKIVFQNLEKKNVLVIIEIFPLRIVSNDTDYFSNLGIPAKIEKHTSN